MWQKTEAGGLFFTVNLVPSLNMAVHGMQHDRLPTTDTIQPPVKRRQSEVPEASPIISLPIYCTRLPRDILSCPRRTLPPALVSPSTYLRGSPDVRMYSLPFRSYWKNATVQREKHYCDYVVRI